MCKMRPAITAMRNALITVALYATMAAVCYCLTLASIRVWGMLVLLPGAFLWLAVLAYGTYLRSLLCRPDFEAYGHKLRQRLAEEKEPGAKRRAESGRIAPLTKPLTGYMFDWDSSEPVGAAPAEPRHEPTDYEIGQKAYEGYLESCLVFGGIMTLMAAMMILMLVFSSPTTSRTKRP